MEMKHGPVTIFDKGNKKTAKKFDNDVISKNCDAFAILQFTVNLEQFGNQNLNA